ncbi:hypothetical protein H5410_036665 [Solanum commersonii]|uniref:TCTP domain-containing protein n=1 Tax=Solanum commersonii TaxID=4109 RepID=A0A9J5Y4X4_SOLCO|nr:hypothetical protein H5410_036665 [Solanum commersonii]
MLVYQDILTDDELLSDSFPYKELENGMLWEVQRKWVVQGVIDVNIRENPYAEGGGEDEGEQQTFDKKQFVTYIKRYIKNLTPKLE